MSENALAVSRPALPELSDLPAEKLRVVQDVLCPGASPSELQLFWAFCQRTGLDPFAKQIYALKRRTQDEAGNWVERLSIQTSIDGFRVIAERNPDYAGQSGPFWCGEDGEWRDAWLSSKPPVAAKVGVLRKGFKEPLFAIALWSEYVQTKRDGSPTAMWRKMPATMLAKCAESQALRRAFPNDMSGTYTTEEMGQADTEPAPQITTPATRREIVADSDAGEVIGAERAAGLKAAMERRGIPPESLDAWLADKGYADRVRDLKVADFPVEIGHAMADWIKAAGAAMKPVAPAEPAKFTATSPAFWKIKAEAAYRVRYPDRDSVRFDADALNYPTHDPEKQPAEAVKGWKDMLADIVRGMFDETPSLPGGEYKQGSLTGDELPF